MNNKFDSQGMSNHYKTLRADGSTHSYAYQYTGDIKRSMFGKKEIVLYQKKNTDLFAVAKENLNPIQVGYFGKKSRDKDFNFEKRQLSDVNGNFLQWIPDNVHKEKLSIRLGKWIKTRFEEVLKWKSSIIK